MKLDLSPAGRAKRLDALRVLKQTLPPSTAVPFGHETVKEGNPQCAYVHPAAMTSHAGAMRLATGK